MKCCQSKKPSLKTRTSSNYKTKVSFTEKKGSKMFGIFYQNHGLTPFHIRNFFGYRKMTFLLSKKPPFEKTTSSNHKAKVSFTEK